GLAPAGGADRLPRGEAEARPCPLPHPPTGDGDHGHRHGQPLLRRLPGRSRRCAPRRRPRRGSAARKTGDHADANEPVRPHIDRMTSMLSPQFEPRDRAGRAYLPIAEHGVIGDLRTVALVGTDATIDWYCPLRFDAPSVFGALLDSGDGGYYRIAPVEQWSTKQLYVPDTNVLITRFLSPSGVGEVQDF